MGFLKDLLLGKKITEQINLKKSKATITLHDGTVHTISREGDYIESAYGIMIYNSDKLLTNYLSYSKRSIIEDDDGKLFAVNNIKTIDIKTEPFVQTITYRK